MCRICISQHDAIERKPFSRIECPTIKFKFELTLTGMLQRGQSKPTRKLGLLASEKYLRSAFFKSCSFFNQASGRVYKFVESLTMHTSMNHKILICIFGSNTGDPCISWFHNSWSPLFRDSVFCDFEDKNPKKKKTQKTFFFLVFFLGGGILF